MAAVEFAIVLPIAMLLVASIVELGTAFYRQQILTSAVREASRAGTISADPRPTQGEIVSAALTFLDDAGLKSAEASVTVSGAGGAAGEALTVSVTYPASLGLMSGLMANAGRQIPELLTLEAIISAEIE
jgi:Flp pilus assembly protein TadG